MKGKFVLNYRLMASIKEAKDEPIPGKAAAPASGRTRSTKHRYLHDHRTWDALEDYLEGLPD